MVVGYDKTPSPLTHTLIDEGIEISFIDDVVSIPSIILENKVESLVVYTPAIPRDNKIFNFFSEIENNISEYYIDISLVKFKHNFLPVGGYNHPNIECHRAYGIKVYNHLKENNYV